jgi:hypothetical protein
MHNFLSLQVWYRHYIDWGSEFTWFFPFFFNIDFAEFGFLLTISYLGTASREIIHGMGFIV